MDTAHRLQPPYSIPNTNSEIAKAYLARGEVAEAEEKWGLALEHYGIALSLLPKDTKTVYFLLFGGFPSRSRQLARLGVVLSRSYQN